MRGRFLEATFQRTERKLAGPGRPGTVDGLVVTVERWEALRLALGARGALPREVGTLIPPPGVPRKHPGASHRSIPSLGFARDWQTSDALRRENVEAWLFEFVDQKSEARRLLTSPRSFAGRGRREAPGEGPGTALPDQKLIGSESLQRNLPTRESVDCIYRSASPLTRSLRCATASTSPRKSGARLSECCPADQFRAMISRSP